MTTTALIYALRLCVHALKMSLLNILNFPRTSPLRLDARAGQGHHAGSRSPPVRCLLQKQLGVRPADLQAQDQYNETSEAG